MTAIITIDSREPDSIKSLQFDGCLVSVDTLSCGDVKIATLQGDLILIERKTPNDFVGSIKDRRIFNQCAEMVELTKWAYLIFDGLIFPQSFPNWEWASIQGVMVSLQEMGVVIMQVENFHDGVTQIMNRSRDEIRVAPRREQYTFSPQETVLMSLPNIGAKKAQEIMQKCGLLGMAIEELTRVGEIQIPLVGIGQKTRQDINEFFGGFMELKMNKGNE